MTTYATPARESSTDVKASADLSTPPVISSSSSSSSTSKKPEKSTLNLNHMLAGSFAGASARFILQPLDLIKVRLQVQDGKGQNEYKSIRHAFTSIVRSEGVAGLYRGLSANLAGAGVSWGSYFFMYSSLKDAYRSHLRKTDPTVTAKHKLSAPAHLACAATSGIVTVCINNPIILIKTRLQLQGRDPTLSSAQLYKNPVDAAFRIVREEGLFSLWNGLGPSMMLVSNGAIQFCLYEEFKKLGAKYLVADEADFQPQHFLLMGGAAKTCSATLTYPLAVIRSRLYAKNAKTAMLQTAIQSGDVKSSTTTKSALASSEQGVAAVIRRTYAENGIRSFYRGLSVQLIKTAPSSALTFMIYESVMRLLAGADATK